jgi:hemerythrin superfamily protein
MDAIELLKDDHKKVEKIFTAMESKDDRQRLFPELDRELSVHAEIEEKIFYPAAKEAEPTRDLVLESIEEHKQIKMVLADLEQTDKTTDEWGAALKVLKEDVMHHVGEEEDELFPKVKKILSTEQLEDLGSRMEKLSCSSLPESEAASAARPAVQ